jgi:hypothetical protein
MTFAGAIFLIAVGAILRYAVNFKIAGVEEHTIGWILMLAGAVGLVIATFQALVWYAGQRRRDRAVDGRRDYGAYR